MPELVLPTEVRATLDVLREVHDMIVARDAGHVMPEPGELRGSMVRYAAEVILGIDEYDRDKASRS